MKVLLVEDDESKGKALAGFVAGYFPHGALDVARSVNEAVRRLRDHRFHLVLLDMSLPTFSQSAEEHGGRAQGFGGREVLRFIRRRQLDVAVIVVTQFEKFGAVGEEMDIAALREVLAREHPGTFNGLVFYDTASEAWQRELRLLLDQNAARLGEAP